MPQNAKPLLWFASCVALLGSGLYGYTLGVLNTSLSNICADLEIAVEGYGAAAVSAVLVSAQSLLTPDTCHPRRLPKAAAHEVTGTPAPPASASGVSRRREEVSLVLY